MNTEKTQFQNDGQSGSDVASKVDTMQEITVKPQETLAKYG